MLDHEPTRSEKLRLKAKRGFRAGWADDGFMSNFFLTLFHLVLILVIPLPVIIFNVWVLIEASMFPSRIEQRTVTIMDAFYPSNYLFWYDLVPAQWTLQVTCGIAAAFIGVSLLELISYYATDFQNTGKYRTVKTLPKRILSFFYWALFNVFIAFYAIIATLFLIWCLLGAILNPSSFLPFASGSATFILFVKTQADKLKHLNESLADIVSQFVDEKLQSTMGASLTSIAKGDKKKNLVYGALERKTKELFGKAIFKAINVGNKQAQLNQEALDRFIKGGFDDMIEFISTSAGIHPIICMAIISVVTDNKGMLLDAIEKLCGRFEVEPKLGRSVAEISLD